MTLGGTELVLQNFNGEMIPQRAADGYVNATAMCKAVGKQWHDYWRLGSTQDFLGALQTETGIPVSAQNNDFSLVQIRKGGMDAQSQGTWVHPKVAINLAQWLSPEFAVWVSGMILDWAMKKQTALAEPMTTGEMLIANAQAFRELEIRQLEATRRLDNHEAKLEAIGAHEDYRSIKAYAVLIGRKIKDRAESSALGRQATALSRQMGHKIGRQPDETFTYVNTYHRDVLEVIFKET